MRIIQAITLFVIILLSCTPEKPERISYMDYSIEEKIDSSWIIQHENQERHTKYLQNSIDSNFYCMTIADTIWYILVFNLNLEDVTKLKYKINDQLKTEYDSVYQPRTQEKFESFKLNWKDELNYDDISLGLIRLSKYSRDSSWILEIRNDSLRVQLESVHDPGFNVKLPWNK